jgi:hypothetical protein
MNALELFRPFLNIPRMFRIEVLVTRKVDKNGRSGSFIENGQERLRRNERVENDHVFKNERSTVAPSKGTRRKVKRC